jgi:hypothetical protein
VILLMFGVGMHFSLRDLLAVRQIAVPGAIGQVADGRAVGRSPPPLDGNGVDHNLLNSKQAYVEG